MSGGDDQHAHDQDAHGHHAGEAGHLVAMARQIGRNLVREADPTGAAAEHIRLFWAPAMIAMLLEAVPRAEPGSADGDALAAIAERLRADAA